MPALRLSPGGRRLAVSIQNLAENAVWVRDLERGSFAKLSPNGEASWPRWSPDGQRIAFQWLQRGVPQVAWQRADGSAPPETLVTDEWMVPSSWSPDGQRFFFARQVPRDPPPPVTHLTLVLNWVEELKAKVPAASGR